MRRTMPMLGWNHSPHTGGARRNVGPCYRLLPQPPSTLSPGSPSPQEYPAMGKAEIGRRIWAVLEPSI